jgi:hypothetical protein
LVSKREFIVVLLELGVEAEGNEGKTIAGSLRHDDEPQLLEGVGEIICSAGEVRHDGAVTVLSKADQLVVLADDLGGAFGEVEGEGGLIGAQVVNVEDKFFGEEFGSAPDDPAYAGVDKAVSFDLLAIGGEVSRRTYLWPDVLIETTFSSLKSHSNSGTTNGATNPPDAASI